MSGILGTRANKFLNAVRSLYLLLCFGVARPSSSLTVRIKAAQFDHRQHERVEKFGKFRMEAGKALFSIF